MTGNDSLIGKIEALKVPMTNNITFLGIAPGDNNFLIDKCIKIIRQHTAAPDGDASTRKDEAHKANASVQTSSPVISSEISDTVTVRRVIDDMPHVAGKGVKFTLRYLEYENDELGCSTGPLDIIAGNYGLIASGDSAPVCNHTWPGKRIGMVCSACMAKTSVPCVAASDMKRHVFQMIKDAGRGEHPHLASLIVDYMLDATREPVSIKQLPVTEEDREYLRSLGMDKPKEQPVELRWAQIVADLDLAHSWILDEDIGKEFNEIWNKYGKAITEKLLKREISEAAKSKIMKELWKWRQQIIRPIHDNDMKMSEQQIQDWTYMGYREFEEIHPDVWMGLSAFATRIIGYINEIEGEIP